MASKEKPALNGVAGLYRARQLVERGILPDDEDFRKRFPCIFSYLTQTAVSETQVIDGSFLRFQNSAGDWQITLGVPALGAFLDAMSPTFNGALDRLEASLATGNADWRWSVKRRPRLRDVGKKDKSP